MLLESDELSVHGIVSLGRLEEKLGRGRKDIIRIADRSGRYYRPFDRRKKNGSSWRHIDNPTGVLKELQSLVQRRILSGVPLPERIRC